MAEGIFPSAEVGQTIVVDCRDQGSYVGTETRRCELGEKDGVWSRPSGYCLSYGLLLILVVLGVLLMIVIGLQVWILRRRATVPMMGVEKGRKATKVTSPLLKGKDMI